MIEPNQIKESTLLIVVEDIQQTGVALGVGMGTLVEVQGESFLVTHNHYGDLLQDMNIVELRDAEHRMIRPIYAYELKSRIVYQDAGTLVLRAPDGLADALTPASLDDDPRLEPGAMVQVVYQHHPDRDDVAVLDAVVEEIEAHKGVPIYRLRAQNGQALHPGDSGGGVWFNGKLVANNWAVELADSVIDVSNNVQPTEKTLTDISYAAIFTGEFHAQLSSSLHNSQEWHSEGDSSLRSEGH
jgi:hypothetical protein